jgi:hypothetical protein
MAQASHLRLTIAAARSELVAGRKTRRNHHAPSLNHHTMLVSQNNPPFLAATWPIMLIEHCKSEMGKGEGGDGMVGGPAGRLSVPRGFMAWRVTR